MPVHGAFFIGRDALDPTLFLHTRNQNRSFGTASSTHRVLKSSILDNKVYRCHTQTNAIKFVDYIRSQFPFRIRMIRTDNGHEFQVQFHWHLKDLGIDHVYIKPHSPRLNGKVKRSHRTDEVEFYQLLEI